MEIHPIALDKYDIGKFHSLLHSRPELDNDWSVSSRGSMIVSRSGLPYDTEEWLRENYGGNNDSTVMHEGEDHEKI